jgi:arylsulfatase A-like enzyme
VLHENIMLPNTSERLMLLARDFLKEEAERPFFLWVHFYDPHAPYDPPESYRTIQNYSGALPKRVGELRKPGNYFPPDDLAYLTSLYLDDVRFVDENVGQLFHVLKEKGIYDQTLIVVTSDHGEEHYEHGGSWHGHSMYDELLRVPLVVKGPAIAQGKRVATPVEIMGLFPTLEHILGLPSAPSDAERQGVGFEGLLQEASVSEHAKPFLYAEEILYGEQQRSVRAGNYKLIEWLGFPRFELYDLAQDPKERRNLYWERPNLSEELKETMTAVARENEQRIDAMPARSDPVLEEETRKRLRALGYLQ